MSVLHGHWKTTTLIAGMRLDSIVAPFVTDWPVNRDILETWVEHVLIPGLRAGDMVVMDNLSSHKRPRVREPIEAASANLLPVSLTASTATLQGRIKYLIEISNF